METFSHIDLFYLTKELKELEEQRIDDFFLTENFFTIHIYSKKYKNVFLKNKLGKFLFYDFEKPKEEKIKNNFIIFLKKKLKNSYIEKIEMIEDERILKFIFRKKCEEKFERFVLYFEIFLKGNLILCDEKNIILNMFRKDNTQRDILRKQEYIFPENKRFILDKIDKKIFSEEILKNDLIIGKFIGFTFGIGKKYCEFILQKAKIEKDFLCKNLNSKQIEKIVFELENLKKQKVNSCILKKEKEILNFYPFDFGIIDLIFEENFNHCIKEYFSQFLEEKSKEEIFLNKEVSSVEKILNSQTLRKKEIEKQIEKYEKIIEKLYLDFSKYENILKNCLEEKEKYKLNFKTQEVELELN